MKTTKKGWVVVSEKHPESGEIYLAEHTFRLTRSGSIQYFIEGTNKSWRWWKRKYNYKCVKAEITIITID